MNLKRFYTTFLLVISCYTMIYAASPKSDGKATKWSIEQANQWAAKTGWLRGANFNPSTAINQLETWQAESFDTVTIQPRTGLGPKHWLECHEGISSSRRLADRSKRF